MKILVVDDSSFIRTIMINILKEGGYEDVIEAASGNEAIEKFESEKPDLIFLDIIMPDMDGLAVLEKMGREANICVLTAVGQDSVVTKAKSLGAKDYITKPFNKESVLQAVKNNIV